MDETDLSVSSLKAEGHPDASVDRLEDGTYFVRTKVLTEDDQERAGGRIGSIAFA